VILSASSEDSLYFHHFTSCTILFLSHQLVSPDKGKHYVLQLKLWVGWIFDPVHTAQEIPLPIFSAKKALHMVIELSFENVIGEHLFFPSWYYAFIL